MRKYIYSLILLSFAFAATASAHDPDKKSIEPLEVKKEALLPKPAEIFEMNKDRFAIINFTITKIETQKQPSGRMPGKRPPGGPRRPRRPRRPSPPRRVERKIPVTLSAFFIDNKGTLMTSGIAAEKPIVSGSIKVVINGKGNYPATFLGKHRTLNVCYFKVNLPANIKYNFIQFNPKDIPSVGDQVLVMSHYGGIFNYMPRFSIERFNGTMKNTRKQTVMLFDATATKVKGMLNGVVFNRKGQAVGLVVLNSFVGAGRKVAKFYTVSLANDVIKATKEIPKPAPKVAPKPKEPPKTVWVGIKMQPNTPELAQLMHKPKMTGVVVTYVVAGAPADEAGIVPGDVITQIGSKKIDCSNNTKIRDLSKWIKTLSVRTDPLFVYRDGKDVKLSIKFAIRDDKKKKMQRYTDKH